MFFYPVILIFFSVLHQKIILYVANNASKYLEVLLSHEETPTSSINPVPSFPSPRLLETRLLLCNFFHLHYFAWRWRSRHHACATETHRGATRSFIINSCIQSDVANIRHEWTKLWRISNPWSITARNTQGIYWYIELISGKCYSSRVCIDDENLGSRELRVISHKTKLI